MPPVGLLLLLALPASLCVQEHAHLRTALLTNSFAFSLLWTILSLFNRKWSLFLDGTRSRTTWLVVGGWGMYSLCARGSGFQNGVAVGSVLVPVLTCLWRSMGMSGMIGEKTTVGEGQRGRISMVGFVMVFGLFAVGGWTYGISSVVLALSAGVFLAGSLLGIEEGYKERGPEWLRNVVGLLAVGHWALWILFDAFPIKSHWPTLWMPMTGTIRAGMLIMLASKYTSTHAGLLELSSSVLLTLWNVYSSSTTPSPTELLASVLTLGAVTSYALGADSVKSGVRPCRTLTLTLCILTTLFVVVHFVFSPYGFQQLKSTIPINLSSHPIPTLMHSAQENWNKRLANQSKTLNEAVTEYKRRYGIPPPPNFDKWYTFAKQNNVLLIDEFDDIHHALRPFWALEPKEIRRRVRQALGGNNGLIGIRLRDGSVGEIVGGGQPWQRQATKEMIEGFGQFLPDMDLAFNVHDESRVLIPDTDMALYLEKAEEERSKVRVKRSVFSEMSAEDHAVIPETKHTDFNVFAHQHVWNHARTACPGSSPVRALSGEDAKGLIYFSFSDKLPFIQNHTAFQDVCLRPSLEHTHGMFVRPNAYNVAQTLLPVFSQSKVSVFSDILYPSPWYWADKAPFEPSKDLPWAEKKMALYWRGSTTGSYSRASSWKESHRQIFIDGIHMKSNQSFTILEKDSSSHFKTKSIPRETLAPLIDSQFSHIGQCDEPDCNEQRDHFDIAPRSNFGDAFSFKTLLDLDGNAFSGRFYAFLQSGAAVLKMNLFREWHEGWLVPWVHYIPVSGSGGEVAEVMNWLKANEDVVKVVGESGKKAWERSLRKEDMQIWLGRLLLEYGRLVDDRRDEIGYEV